LEPFNEFIQGYSRSLIILRVHAMPSQGSIDNLGVGRTPPSCSRKAAVNDKPMEYNRKEDDFPKYVTDMAKRIVGHLLIV
ncbi:hypothetical protein PFISCL1PPCAC_23610, partial [Pristionchus fissidentatus]